MIKAAYCDDDVPPIDSETLYNSVPEDLAETHSSSSTPAQPSLEHYPTQLSTGPSILASALSLTEDKQKHMIKAAYCDDDVHVPPIDSETLYNSVPEDLAETHSSPSTPAQPSLEHYPTQLSTGPFILASALSLTEDKQKHMIKAAYCDDDVHVPPIDSETLYNSVPEDLAETHSSPSTPAQPSLEQAGVLGEE